MIKQEFHVQDYWKVMVYWNVDYGLSCYIEKDMHSISMKDKTIYEVLNTMQSGEAKAVTCSSIKHHESIVLFNKHSSAKDYVSSIVHEAEHIKQAMLTAYQVEDRGEAPAYTIGYLVSRMWEVFKGFICS